MKRNNPGERGVVIVTTILLILVIAALCYAFLTNRVSLDREHHGRTEQTKALYVAEAGTSVAAVETLRDMEVGEVREVGSADNPIPFEGGTYWLEATSHADGSYTLLVHATHARTSLSLETRWERALHAIRDHAIFSGNLGLDARHDLEFGGTGRSDDVVDGKVYAAGSVTVRGGAAIHGDVTATGVVSGVDDGDVVQNAPRIG